MRFALAAVTTCFLGSWIAYGSPVASSSDVASAGDGFFPTRLDKIKSMYAWEGFVYDIEACQDFLKLVEDFARMRLMGARNVITFDYCGTGADATYYDTIITAAGWTGINIIPLVWTLPIHPIGQNYTTNDTFAIKSVPRIYAVTQAVIRNPGPVLAVALGDEPLYDNDAGSADALAAYILQMKASFQEAGLDIPVSISDMAYGWQISGNITSVQDAVDFFMINNFPYFDGNAVWGGDNNSWASFLSSIDYFQSLANGRPLLVTQTGWPSNTNTFAPNSADVIATVPSEEAFFKLLDSHCEDYFKQANIGWMWRNWDDAIDGWGALYDNGTEKWPIQARLDC
ncbi:glycoside hydrolase family 17 protein [Calocera viscosa TUFC12733]|uniref:glucan endo-1,3-beta-D-glucosidase n=1 Tax=Calocera viscosa (strain TUFC12733) TaxID=1330018 RepID=A0A167REB8_CALVF|nr:glycoside hydrolase family 17 protein [Calocera viscosa TUFC12733]